MRQERWLAQLAPLKSFFLFPSVIASPAYSSEQLPAHCETITLVAFFTVLVPDKSLQGDASLLSASVLPNRFKPAALASGPVPLRPIRILQNGSAVPKRSTKATRTIGPCNYLSPPIPSRHTETASMLY
ncbi:hypothetical protein QBC46DRAFT_409579 [Diplogelasinospora grovesii]|uniref:Secreted protein n=1 Tax=Diplogelasinospora grovesii TaxID=303347 RepID=A0AAN6S2V9_9PEZI|nr:hypothetical protein QBC46DRAFT_409579 [Diplogelasinospora grovesii]